MSRLRKILIFVIFVIIIITTYFSIEFFKPIKYSSSDEVKVAKHQDFIIATGGIRGKEDVVLSFRQGGVVEKIFVEVGDKIEEGKVIAKLDTKSIEAEIKVQRFKVEQEKVHFNSAHLGPEKLEREEIIAKLNVSQQELESSFFSALTKAQEIAVETENIIRVKVDTYFDGGDESIRYIGDANIPNVLRITENRENLEKIFDSWRSWIIEENVENKKTLLILTLFIKDLYIIQGFVQDLYDISVKYRNVGEDNKQLFERVSVLRSDIQKAISSIVSSYNGVRDGVAITNLVRKETESKLSGGTQVNKDIQKAEIAAAQENLRIAAFKLEETEISAPFTGVVGQIFIDESEFVSSGGDAVRIISDGGFEIVVDITEVEIQFINIGDQLKANIEATNEDMAIKVRTIDQTERKVSGVPVYQVVFDILTEEVKLRTGMTINTFIPFGKIKDLFEVMPEAIQKNKDGNFVVVERGGENIEVPVFIQATLVSGLTGVTGKLEEGDTLFYDIK